MGDELNKKELQKLLESGNKKKCMQFFQGMSESKRRECFAIVKPFWNQVRKTRFIEDPPGTFRGNPLNGIACIAYFATATGSEIIKAKRMDILMTMMHSRFSSIVNRTGWMIGSNIYWASPTTGTIGA